MEQQTLRQQIKNFEEKLELENAKIQATAIEMQKTETEIDHIEESVHQEIKAYVQNEFDYMFNNGNAIRPSRNNKTFIKYFMLYQKLNDYDWDDIPCNSQTISKEQAKSIFQQEEERYIASCYAFEDMIADDRQVALEASDVQLFVQQPYQSLLQWLQKHSDEQSFLQIAGQLYHYYTDLLSVPSDVVAARSLEIHSEISNNLSSDTATIELFIESLMMYLTKTYPTLSGDSSTDQDNLSIFQTILQQLSQYKDDLKQCVVEKKIWHTHTDQYEEYLQSIGSEKSHLKQKYQQLSTNIATYTLHAEKYALYLSNLIHTLDEYATQCSQRSTPPSSVGSASKVYEKAANTAKSGLEKLKQQESLSESA